MLQRFLRATADIQLAFTASSWFPNEGSYGICTEIYDQPPIYIGKICKPVQYTGDSRYVLPFNSTGELIMNRSTLKNHID